ncbi:MAG: tetratricopeptide repeat protein [Bacteroidia bacterium]
MTRNTISKYLKLKSVCILIVLSITTSLLNAQVDSVNQLISKETDIQKKVEILLQTCKTYSNSEVSLNFSKQAYSLAYQINNGRLVAKSAEQLAISYFVNKQTDSVKKYLGISENLYLKNNDKIGLYYILFYQSKFFLNEGDTKKAFEINKQLIAIAESLNDNEKLANAYGRMGALFVRINDYDKAISYYEKSLKIFKQLNDYPGIERTYKQIGDSYYYKSFYDLAIECYERGLEVNKKTNNEELKSNILVSIGNVYYELDNNEKALYFYTEASKLNTKDNLVIKNNIASVLMNMNRYKDAKPYLLEYYYTTTDIGDKAIGAFNLSQTYEQLGDYNSAMDFMDIYVRINDSLNDVKYKSNLSEIEAKYRNEKQEEQNILLNERLKNKSLQIYFALAAILLLVGLAFFIFRGLRQKNKANLALAEKNKIIEEKSLIVEEQHKDITDSIKYAQRIQQAILPPDKLWNSILPQSFVFYQPKDILSGDFYWIEETSDYIFVAAADCTGHGVPGALMSIVNYNLLNRAVLEHGLTDAGAILDSVNKYLTLSLHQTFQESAVRDGMDVSLCVIEKSTKKMNFAGAFNSIYLIRNNEVKEFIPDKQPVGAFIEDNIKPFKNQFFQLQENDVVYMFTDGYADQFGGPKGKKYKYKQLQQLLIDCHTKPFDEQKTIVKKSINDWKGNLEQVDDILLLGFKVV